MVSAVITTSHADEACQATGEMFSNSLTKIGGERRL